MIEDNIARVYATSLLDIAVKNNLIEQISEELEFVAGLFEEEEDFRSYMNSPSFSKDMKKNFVKKVFDGKLSEYIVNFINVLVENGRQANITDINFTFGALVDELNNRMRVDVTSTTKLDNGTIENIKSVLKQKFGKDIIINEKTDAAILGGIIIKAGDLVIDGSLAENLKKIRYNLLNSKVRSEVAYED